MALNLFDSLRWQLSRALTRYKNWLVSGPKVEYPSFVDRALAHKLQVSTPPDMGKFTSRTLDLY